MDRPTAAPAHFPYAHRTLEQVDAQERVKARVNHVDAYRAYAANKRRIA